MFGVVGNGEQEMYMKILLTELLVVAGLVTGNALAQEPLKNANEPEGGHGGHAANALIPNASAGQSTPLAQAIRQAPGGAHGSHGTVSGGAGANGAPHSGGHNITASIPSGGSHPQHFPIGMSNHGGGHDFHERALGLRAYRQQLIASNIANADTPNYKAVDIDFQKALQQAPSSLKMATTSPNHLQGQASNAFTALPLIYPVPHQVSLDRVGGHYKMMNELFNSLRQ